MKKTRKSKITKDSKTKKMKKKKKSKKPNQKTEKRIIPRILTVLNHPFVKAAGSILVGFINWYLA